MMKVSEAVKTLWVRHLFAAAVALAFFSSASGAVAGDTGSTDEYGGVALINSELLDPFDPVPEIRFRHGCGDWYCERRCYHDCGEERWHCYEDCRWHGWYCPHDCNSDRRFDGREENLGWWRCADDCRDDDWWCDHNCRLEGWHCEHDCYIHEPCERDCRDRHPFRRCEHDCREEGEHCTDTCYGRLIHQYEERIERSDEQSRQYEDQAQRYEEQSRWYFEHVIDENDRDFDHYDDQGYFDAPPGPLGSEPEGSYLPPPGPLGPPPATTYGPGPYGPPPSN